MRGCEGARVRVRSAMRSRVEVSLPREARTRRRVPHSVRSEPLCRCPCAYVSSYLISGYGREAVQAPRSS